TQSGSWAPLTVYNRGQVVTDTVDGKQYAPRKDNPDQTLAPHVNLAEGTLYDPKADQVDWLSSQGQSMTNSLIATNLSGPSASIVAAEPGGSVATTGISTVPSAGTSATIDGTVVAGRHVHAWAKDMLDVNGLAGAVAAGFV